MWQEAVLTASGLVFAVLLLPTLRDESASVPRTTSVPTALSLYAIAATYATMSLWFAAATAGLTGLMWSGVAVWRE